GEEWVLRDVNFEIAPKQTLAIVGATGSGKTTIISLINRLYPLQKGRIYIDDVPHDQYDLSFLRSQTGIVLQDVYLFSGTIRDNLTLRNPAISEEEVIKAAKMVDLHDFILKLPGGYDFNIRERGALL